MDALPESRNALVVRTDFSDEVSWLAVCHEIDRPVGEFRAYVTYLSDRQLDGADIPALVRLAKAGPYRSYLFVVDDVTIRSAEHPICVVDLIDDPGRSFRVLPREMWGVENNLSLANMDFSEFAEAAGQDDTFRGFDDG